MNLCIFQTSLTTYSVKRFQQQLSKDFPNDSLLLLNPFELSHKEAIELIENKRITHILNRVTGISYDDSDLDLLKQIDSKIKSHYPPITMCPTFRCKKQQARFYQSSMINHPRTMFLDDLEIENKGVFSARNGYLIKPFRSNQGRGIIKVKDLKEALQKARDRKFIIQEYLPSKSEYRVLIIGSQIVGALLKHRVKNQHERGFIPLNSASSELEFIEPLKIPKELKKSTQDLIKLSSLHTFALDFLCLDENFFNQRQSDITGPYVLLELNICPGFEYFEKISGLNIAQKIINSLKAD